MNSTDNRRQLVGTTLLATVVIVATAGILVMAIDFVLLIFLGLLFGVLLTKTSVLLGKAVPLAYGWNLAIVTTSLLGVLAGGLMLFGVQIEDRLQKTSQQLDESAEKLESWVNDYPLAASVFRKIPFSDQMGLDIQSADENPGDTNEDSEGKSPDAATGQDKGQGDPTNDGGENGSDGSSSESDSSTSGERQPTKESESTEESGASEKGTSAQQRDTDKQVDRLASSDVLKKAAGEVFTALGKLLATTFGLAANVGVIFFIGLFLAVNPTEYRDGFSQLFPPDRRDRVVEVMNLMGTSMFNWLKGRFLSMLITGAGTAVALAILNVPMPITIGVITGLLTFVPNIGAVIALGLAMLMALSVGPMTVVWVVVLYAVLQLIESNIITPLIQKHQTSIPPALLLACQILMAALTGFLGVMVATPLLAAGMVLVKEVWIKDTLESSTGADAS